MNACKFMNTAMAIVAIAWTSGCAPKDAQSLPDWAYPINNAGAPPDADAGTPLKIPGSDQSFTRTELGDLFSAPDWRRQDHPPMPEIVARGRPPEIQACAYCHLPTGNGRPENARLAGLPADYITSQMQAYRSGQRGTSVPGRAPTALMAAIGKAATDEEIAAAAAYFSSLQPRSFVRVIESRNVPRTEVAGWVFKAKPSGGREPLGQRIVEMPEDFELLELRDPMARYVAYAPPGSIARGSIISTAKTKPDQLSCADCHGADFRGAGAAPSLAGRSPSYIARQLNDFRSGARRGAGTELMAPIAERLDNDQKISIAAYLASLPP